MVFGWDRVNVTMSCTSTRWRCIQDPEKPLGLKLKGMTYEEIKERCLKENRLFEDPDFDAVHSILHYRKCLPCKPYAWKRPTVITVLSFFESIYLHISILHTFRMWPGAFSCASVMILRAFS